MQLGRPILLFIMGEKHPVTEADIELDPDKRKKLDAFRQRAKRMREGSEVERVYELFDSLEQFSRAATIAVGRLAKYLAPNDGVAAGATDITEADAALPFALSNIPIHVPRLFMGRDDALAAIETALRRFEGRVAITALHGLRGVGKSTLAAAFAERHRGDYRATWWIRAQTEPTLRADLVALGVRLGWIGTDDKEEAALAATLERLRHEGEGLLLIFDNATEARALSPYLPRGGAAHVLVTSNAPDWRRVAEPVELRLWPQAIGADYLIARTGREGERAAAEALSEVLGGLPLAHEQAGAYCERLGLSLAEYRRRFEAAPARLLDADRDAPAEYHDGLTVAKTFALAIDEAAKLHPAAEPLIVHAALLAPEPIPLFVFSDAREHFGEPLASLLADEAWTRLWRRCGPLRCLTVRRSRTSVKLRSRPSASACTGWFVRSRPRGATVPPGRTCWARS
jgi:hypothetical protein